MAASTRADSSAAVSARVVALFADDLRAFLARRVPDEATAADLLQEVFLTVHGRAEQLRDDERVAGWVFRIARNVLADHYRRGEGRAARRARPGATLEELPGEGGCPEERAAADQHALLARWLVDALETLPARYRDAMRLVELEGVPRRVAAERLGLSYSGLRSRVQRGRRLLREILERCCDVELDPYGRVVDYRRRSACVSTDDDECC
jgi:RNA polymerase sigma-70 factor (ECF subfamily)